VADLICDFHKTKTGDTRSRDGHPGC
jgi:hypothetical protein